MSIRVVLAEDNYLLRAGITGLLAAVPEVELLASVEDQESLLSAVAQHRPDVVITDIRMPPTHTTEGLVAAALVRQQYPGTGVILLTQFADPEYAMELLRDGAEGAGYLLKEHIADLDELTRSLHQVASGGTALDPLLVEALVHRKTSSEDLALSRLSPREREVLEHMAQGKNNAAIARSLVLTEKSVQKHINSLFSKLGISGSTDLDRRVAAVLALLDSRAKAG
ncbi:response regulator transcription factor [Streptomyces sp.]|uniref:response regulator transcription factor n=1 Tax=Streptomyces sp. TaxID=1931 RepID=UPI002F3FF1EE